MILEVEGNQNSNTLKTKLNLKTKILELWRSKTADCTAMMPTAPPWGNI